MDELISGYILNPISDFGIALLDKIEKALKDYYDMIIIEN